jgi:hypothetical protein
MRRSYRDFDKAEENCRKVVLTPVRTCEHLTS